VTGEALLLLMALGQQLIITHGTGLVVERRRCALARTCQLMCRSTSTWLGSQGGVAYLLMQALQNALRPEATAPVVCLLTQVVVDPRSEPVEAVGDLRQEEARVLGHEMGWLMREDLARLAHVVPSPCRGIVDVSLIQTMAESGAVVIARRRRGAGRATPRRRRHGRDRRGPRRR
jgi:carbamate kinase